MIEIIKELLIRGIDAEKLTSELSLHFTETLEPSLDSDEDLRRYLKMQPTLKAFFTGADDGLEKEDTIELIEDLDDDLDYGLMNQFDLVEDGVKEELLSGKMASAVRKDLASQGIVLMRNDRAMSEDLVEEAYLEAFQDFDRLRIDIMDRILAMSPFEFYERGKQARENFRKSRGLQMDELDFNRQYLETFDKEALWGLFSLNIFEAITYHSRYVLESAADDDDESLFDQEELLDDLLDPEDPELIFRGSHPHEAEDDAVLVANGDLHPEEFTFVYELMSEYTGHRVMPYEDGMNPEAYWATYGDDFAETLALAMINHLEETIRYFNEQRPADYQTLARLYGWSRETRQDPVVVLETCDKIAFFLQDLQERLWDELLQSELMPLYLQGKKLHKERDEIRLEGKVTDYPGRP